MLSLIFSFFLSTENTSSSLIIIVIVGSDFEIINVFPIDKRNLLNNRRKSSLINENIR